MRKNLSTTRRIWEKNLDLEGLLLVDAKPMALTNILSMNGPVFINVEGISAMFQSLILFSGKNF